MSSDRNDMLRQDAVGYNPTEGTYHLNHDETEHDSLSYTVLRAVSAITGQVPHALDPLSDTIDPDALDKLFELEGPRDNAVDACLTIEYNGCQVAVYSDGHLVVEPPKA